MCEREREFCHFLIFRSGWKWYRCEDGYKFSSQAIECRFFYKSFAFTESWGNENLNGLHTYQLKKSFSIVLLWKIADHIVKLKLRYSP